MLHSGICQFRLLLGGAGQLPDGFLRLIGVKFCRCMTDLSLSVFSKDLRYDII